VTVSCVNEGLYFRNGLRC